MLLTYSVGLVDGAYLFVGWLVVVVGAMGCGSRDVVVWVVTDLFIATVVVAGAVAGFGADVHALFVVVVVVDGEEGVWEWDVGMIRTDQCSCGIHPIFGVYIFTNSMGNRG